MATDYNTFEFARYADAHKDTSGAGDARPTALQIIKDNNLEAKLSGKIGETPPL